VCFVPRIPADFITPTVYLTNQDESGGASETRCVQILDISQWRHLTSYVRNARRLVTRFFP
jgi:hypothetical protein